MPLYQYRCPECGAETEEFRALSQFDRAGPQCCTEMTRVIAAPRVIRDIEPYQAMGMDVATGKAPMITGRSEHREYLKRNGYVEVGNDRPKSLPSPDPDRNEIARQVKTVMDEKGIRA
jgi:putative FmdB family regulatory protein